MPGLHEMAGNLVSFTITLIEQVLTVDPTVAFQVTVVVPLFNFMPFKEVPVPVVAPLKV